MIGVIEAYCEWLTSRGLARRTISHYRRVLLRFAGFLTCHDVQLEFVDVVMARKYVAELHARYSSHALRTIRAVIRAFFVWMVSTDRCTENPFAKLALSRVWSYLPPALPEADVLRFLDGGAESCPHLERDRAIVELLYSSALRAADVPRLLLTDIDYAKRLIRVGGRNAREVPFGRRALAALEAYVQIRPSVSYPQVFLNRFDRPLTTAGVIKLVERWGLRSGVPMTPERLRCSGAVHLLERGADIRWVQEMLGHRVIDSTKRYQARAARPLIDVHTRTHPHGG